jgi:hypothetical protein
MADEKPNRDGYFVARAFEAPEHAFTIEVVADAIQVAFLGPVATTRLTLTRAETRDVACHMMEASQQIDEEEEE